jgi:IS5 family transposase
MKPKQMPPQAKVSEPIKAKLSQMLNPQHPLVSLAQSIDWSVFEQAFGPLYAEEMGRPALPTRLMVGLHYLKQMEDVSDEAVVAAWVENPYWQYFCGCDEFQHQWPCHPTSLVKWRQRVGVDGMEQLLKETVATARRAEVLPEREPERVNVDTTVQEKAIAFPTDARLYEKARRALVRAALRLGVKLRQSYVRLGKRALRKQSQYAHAQQGRRARRETKKLWTYPGRVIRDIERKCPQPDDSLQRLLHIAQRIYQQQRTDTKKVYSVHAPEVECIAKGKAHQRYEFGCKVPVVTTSKHGWVVAIDAVHGNPYDGHTLNGAIDQMERLTGVRPKQTAVDRGFKGKDHHPVDVEVLISGRRGLSRTVKAFLRRRSAIEPVIGHLKSDHRLDRNYLLGRDGDRINALLSGCGFNLRKLLRALARFLFVRILLSRWIKEQQGSPAWFRPVRV